MTSLNITYDENLYELDNSLDKTLNAMRRYYKTAEENGEEMPFMFRMKLIWGYKLVYKLRTAVCRHMGKTARRSVEMGGVEVELDWSNKNLSEIAEAFELATGKPKA